MSSRQAPNATIKCVECGLRLPIRFPKTDEKHRTYGCAFCGAIHAGIVDETASAEVRQNIKEIDSDLDRS